MNPFSYLRRLAKDAITAGVADGLIAVVPPDAEPPADLAELMHRLEAARTVPALAAAPEPEEVPAKRTSKK